MNEKQCLIVVSIFTLEAVVIAPRESMSLCAISDRLAPRSLYTVVDGLFNARLFDSAINGRGQ